MINPIRIKTKVGPTKVITLFFNGKWLTIPGDYETDSMQEAGQNHLLVCKRLIPVEP